MDDVNMYAYKNWALGELVDGPHVNKYDTTMTFMWEQNKMPDPDAGKRLLNIGGKVEYKRDVKMTPRRIESYSDYRPGTKKAKLDAIVCSGHEIRSVKKVFKKEIITPGIKIQNTKNDQKRIMKPKDAFAAGSDWLVIGRPITKGNIKNNIKKLIDHLNK